MARKKLGKYEIIDRIGRGGMAEVYRGYHAALDRYVAVKLLHPFLADDPEFKDRFENEARNVAKLKHPNIVQVYDFEYDAEGESYYMVMELINGPTLKDRLFELVSSGERLPIGEAIRIVKSAAEALAYAHQRNMIHRDVKPANLMLDEDQRVVLTDFGIAKIVTGTQFTASGGMVGTPAYMAPEQGLGEAGDERSDLYSLGVILYQLVTGKLPFDAETPLAIILKHLNEPLPAPHEVMPDIPQDLEQVICRSLAKDAEERYQTAADFAADLNRLDENGNLLPIYEAAARAAAQDTPAPNLAVAPDATIPTRPQGLGMPGAPGRLRFTWVLGLVAGIILMVTLALVGFGSDESPFSSLLGSKNSDTPQATLTALALASTYSADELTATAQAVIAETASPTATIPTPTETPQPSDTPTITPSVTPSPLPTDTPTPTFTPSPNMTGTALANFFATQSAATPTPNMTQTLASCSFEFIVAEPEDYNQPPAISAVNDPRLVEAGQRFSFELVLLNTGSCPWPAGARLTYNENLTLDPGSSVDMEPLRDVCEDAEIRPGLNFAVQQRSNFRLETEVDIEEESDPIVFQGTAPSVFGCYYGVWDVLYPNSDTPAGRPLLLTIRVWGGGE